MNRIIKLIVVIIFSMGMSCSNKQSHNFQSGDILFRGSLDSSLSQAIDAVTQTQQQHHYTHMGLVEVVNDTIWVIHAAPVKGVCRELLNDFSMPEGDSMLVGHYRIKNLDETTRINALKHAKSALGQPYNNTYILEDEGYYCSEFIHDAFVCDSVFKLNPMTFIDPESGDFHDGWIKHYAKLGIDIPEGQPGCNPNGIAANSRLEFLGILNKYLHRF